ncbi:hypothetical protein [Aeromonas veronii]|uniref:hypothetical protein n=1 Tax=Aeromonas veronii TaxID=654 RepID=UPI003B9ED995
MTQEKKEQDKVVELTYDKGQSQDRANVKKGYQPTRADNSAEKPINPPPKKP